MITLASLVLSATAAGSVAITNVAVEVGDGTTLERAAVVFAGRHITAVGKATPPPDARVIDDTGQILAPGFIESLSRIGLTEVGMEERTNDYVDGASVAPGFRAADGFNPASVRIPINREEGVTSAITTPTGTLLFGTGAWVDLTGDLHRVPDPGKPIAMYGGVEVIISAFDWDNNLRRLRQEAGIAVAYGLPRPEAMRALTERPARIFGRDDSLGTVSVGKRANLVLWSGDPLELRSIATHIWIDGTSQPLDNRQRRLAHRCLEKLRAIAAPEPERP